MAYTEIKERNRRIYYYRVLSQRKGSKISKKRIYLGVNLNKADLEKKVIEADKKINFEKSYKNIKKIKSKIIPILKKYKVKKAGIFGSFVRGEQKKHSDIDILVEPPKGIGWKFVRISEDLEKKLKKKVDLVTYDGLNKHLKDRILKEEVKII